MGEVSTRKGGQSVQFVPSFVSNLKRFLQIDESKEQDTHNFPEVFLNIPSSSFHYFNQPFIHPSS